MIHDSDARVLTPDAGYIYRERDATPQSIVNAYLIADDATTPAELDHHLRVRIPAIPEFSRTLVRSRFEVAAPRWVPAPGIRLSDHVFTRVADRPGPAGLRRALGAIADRRLDLSIPPWEVHLVRGLSDIPGLPGRSSALVIKIHHCACDGVRSAEIGRLLLGQPPEHVRSPAALSPQKFSFADALRTLPAQRRAYARSRADLASLRDAVTAAERAGTIRTPVPARPRTRFNARPSGERTISIVRFDLETIQRVRRLVHGATVNDVLLATVAGGLRSLLTEIGELPAESLATMVPRSVRGLHHYEFANQFIPMIVDLHTNVDDPATRLELIHASVADEKVRTELPPMLQSLDCVGAIPASLTRLGSWMDLRRPPSRSTAGPANTVVSNYLFEPHSLAFSGSPVVAASCLPMLDDGMLLGHMVATAGKTLTLTVSADRRAVPDPGHYGRLLCTSFEQLGGHADILC